MGYTRSVQQKLTGKANIIHNPGNSQGTTHTLNKLDEWLDLQDWDVIHFNLGLHDLKRVKVAGTSQNSNDPNDPYQADRKIMKPNGIPVNDLYHLVLPDMKNLQRPKNVHFLGAGSQKMAPQVANAITHVLK